MVKYDWWYSYENKMYNCIILIFNIFWFKYGNKGKLLENVFNISNNIQPYITMLKINIL